MEYKFSKEEIATMKEKMSSFTTHIPTNMTGYIWGTYKKIKGSRENQPCSCGSAAKHWRKAVDTINLFLKSYDNDRTS